MRTRYGIWAALSALSVAAAACSSPESLSASGGACLMATDCALGLVCVKDKCTADLSSLVNIEGDAGGGVDAAAMNPPTDASTAAESASPEASTTPPTEAGTPIVDATSPPMEAAPPIVDSGGGREEASRVPETGPAEDTGSTSPPGPDASSAPDVAVPDDSGGTGAAGE
jgi:hypothetical protein